MDHQSPDQTDELDGLIFSNRKLEAMLLLRRQQGLGLAEAIEGLASRYQELRATFPERFTCDDAEYWKGFYS
jgi:hypothetical protein